MKLPALVRHLALLAGGLLLAACHRTADPDPNPGGCQLTYASGSSNYFTYFYNATGQLTAARTPSALGELHYDYSYAGLQVKLPVTYDNNSTWMDWVLTLNAQGYLATATSYFSAVGGQVRQQATFAYDADGHLTGYHANAYTLGAGLTDSLRVRLDYQNGDLTQLFDSVDNSLTELEYSSQANQLRIPLLLESMSLHFLNLDPGLLPLLGKPTAHLAKALRIVQPVSPYPYSTTFTYLLDSNGQLTTFTTNNGLSTTYRLTNTCP